MEQMNLSGASDAKEKLESIFIGFNSPLHKANLNQDSRSIDILLSFMAKIPKNNSKLFKDILPDLIESGSFKVYLSDLCTQSHQMRSK
jgi:hypothetical protein